MHQPKTDWTLNELAAFCKNTLRKGAEAHHAIGTALLIARERHKKNRAWIAWLREQVGISQASSYRYMQVAKAMTVEEVRNRPICEVYRQIGQFSGKRNRTAATNAEKNVSFPSWGVSDGIHDELEQIADALGKYIARNSDVPFKDRLTCIVQQLRSFIDAPTGCIETKLLPVPVTSATNEAYSLAS